MVKINNNRIIAIRKNVSLLDEHIQDFICACENIQEALDTLEDATLLGKIFIQTTNSLRELSLYTKQCEESLQGNAEELMLITRIDNKISAHVRRIEELIVNIQKIYTTHRLGQAVGFALIEQEIARIRRARRNILELYYTIKAHYADQDGKITNFLEKPHSGTSLHSQGSEKNMNSGEKSQQLHAGYLLHQYLQK